MQDFVGRQIDGYRVLERVGIGGMAVVYKAYDIRLEREVALKLIRKEAIPPEQAEHLLRRFEREAKAQAMFSHPHIVPVFDYGEWQGIPYLVMANVPGGTLKDKMGKPVPWEKALSWIIPIADALSYAHKRGVVHRDIKPANILLNTDGQPILADFGIAKVLESTDSTLTGVGMGVGTPAYMAPEQWKGQTCEASDQYSLATVFYELITGKKPYSAETPAAVMIQQATEPLRAPSEWVAAIPKAVELVLYKAMALNPIDRYADMDAFHQALLSLSKCGRSAVLNQPIEQGISRPGMAHAHEVNEGPIPQGGVKNSLKWFLWIGLPIVLIIVGLIALVLGGVIGDKSPKRETSETDSAALSSTKGITAFSSPIARASKTITPEHTLTLTATTAPTLTDTPVNLSAYGVGSKKENQVDGAVLMFVPAGEFLMGSTGNYAEEDEYPQHTVDLDAYWIYQTEVTSLQYRACIEVGACDGDLLSFSESIFPAVDINWNQAAAYCEWAGGRLPTEAEWEKAARGTDGRTYPWGGSSPNCTLANYAGCIEGRMPVGNYPEGISPYGALDMAGNVWEWVGDWYASDYYAQSPDANPAGPETGIFKVLRGGSWNNYGISDLRTTNRYANVPDNPNENFGFRCVQVP